jgi:Putative Ig domain
MPNLVSLASVGSKRRAINWVTSSGRLASGTTLYTNRSCTTSVEATSLFSENLVYSVVSGALPGGLSLNTSTGAITGTITNNIVSDFTTNNNFSFTIRATGAQSGVSQNRDFNLLVNSFYVGYSCLQMGEGACGSVTAPGGFVFTRVDFSSYGTPNGGCGSYSIGGCHTGFGVGMPTTTVSICANNGVQGDPCGGTGKRYYGQFSYSPS